LIQETPTIDINKRINQAIDILRKIDWVGSGAKGMIEDVIGLLIDK